MKLFLKKNFFLSIPLILVFIFNTALAYEREITIKGAYKIYDFDRSCFGQKIIVELTEFESNGRRYTVYQRREAEIHDHFHSGPSFFVDYVSGTAKVINGDHRFLVASISLPDDKDGQGTKFYTGDSRANERVNEYLSFIGCENGKVFSMSRSDVARYYLKLIN